MWFHFLTAKVLNDNIHNNMKWEKAGYADPPKLTPSAEVQKIPESFHSKVLMVVTYNDDFITDFFLYFKFSDTNNVACFSVVLTKRNLVKKKKCM